MSPHSPHRVNVLAQHDPLGLVAELVRTRPLAEVEAELRGFGRLAGDDRATAALRAATGGTIDLSTSAHRRALLSWLRAWGCRHLRVADTVRSSRALAAWWRRYGASMSRAERTIVELGPSELDASAAAYGALAAAPAAWRTTPTGRVSVGFGATAAAKALFAIRPLAHPPWDEPIRAALGLGAADGYRRYLELVADALTGLSRRLDVPVPDVPAALGRPGSTPPQLVDEYLWMRSRRR